VLAAGVFVAMLALSACDEGEKTVEITDVRDRSKTEAPANLGVEAGERLFDWRHDLPEGWREVPSPPEARDRVATFAVSGRPDLTCALSVLAGGGGGLDANVNRWRTQMGLEPLAPEAVAALPKRPFLGGDATLVDVAGTFAGMGGGPKVENARLLGLIAMVPRAAVFLKCVGSAEAVAAERDRFLALGASTRSRAIDRMRRAGATRTTEAPAAAPYEWTLPAGWRAGPAVPARLATFFVDDAPGLEVTVHEMGGGAGGALAIVNRWRSHMGLKDIDAAGLSSLPRVRMLDGDATVVDLSGHLVDEMRRLNLEDARQVGAILDRGSSSVFVRMTGPSALVAAQRSAFDAFVASMRATGSGR
jgi:hypothetical protein